MESLRKAHGNSGYLHFTSVPNTKFDDENKRISLTDLDEGKQFHASRVEVSGLSEYAQEVWKDLSINRGQVYDSRLWGSMLSDCEIPHTAATG